MVESNSNRFRSPSVFKTVQDPVLITFQCMVDRGRIELPPKTCKAPVLPLSLTAHKLLAGVTGFEPVFTISKTVALGQTKLYPNKFFNALLPMRVLKHSKLLRPQ